MARWTRRSALAALAAAGTTLLASCTGRGGDDRLATTAREVTSPSGEYRAGFDVVGEELRPVIRDADGAALWTDDLPHLERHSPGVVWESEADVLWVLSTDHGNASVRQDAAGEWEKTMGSDAMPPDVAELAR